MTQQRFIANIKRLSEENTLQVVADSLSQLEILNCYNIYIAEKHEEPDSILEALDFIINTF